MNNFKNIDYNKLIKGYYEVEKLPKNFSPESYVPDFGFNILNHYSLLYSPLLDEHFLEIGGQKPIWPMNKTFAVCLTHDVDIISLNSLKQSLRSRKQKMFYYKSYYEKIKNIGGIFSDFVSKIKQIKIRDPLHCYERWINAEKEVGANSTFFFWPGRSCITKPHFTDCLYELLDKVIFDKQKCNVIEMMKEIYHRGCEIGLHSSWYSFNDISEIKKQKEAIEKALNHKIHSVRQHYLHYDIRITPSVQAKAGFKYDSTLGFNDNIGFRFGTCYPWQIYDLRKNVKLPLIEIPLIIQDGAILNNRKGLRLDKETAFEYIVMITNAVENVGGVLTILWHPNDIINSDKWNLYLKILHFLKRKNPWFATIKEVGDWRQKITKDLY